MDDILLERFLAYVKIDTQSKDGAGAAPSTPGQFVLAHRAEADLKAIGMQNVSCSSHCVVTAELPATPGCENAPVMGLIAHLDTSDAASGKNVNPSLVRYDGTPVRLGETELVLSEEKFPALKTLAGKTLIVTDGTTLLGADDKAGMAEIVCALERIIAGKIPHGALRVAFTPDEEIGCGTDQFDVTSFGADIAFTADGGEAGAIEYQNFNAAQAKVAVKGLSVHPGSAKNGMKNAIRIGLEFQSLLPPGEVPEETEGLQGFYHLHAMTGSVSGAVLHYLLRDHDAASFANRKRTMEKIASHLNEKYGAGTVELEITDQYRNMKEIIDRHPGLIELASRAMRDAGLPVSYPPVRGGTDGARLSFDGLPCPNLGTGGCNYHSECEFAVLEDMHSSVDALCLLIRYAGCAAKNI